jgi:hypothetical protein
MPALVSVTWQLVLFGPTNAHAAMYCGNDLITEGMTKLDVISKCGAPDLKEVASVNTFGVADRSAFRASTSAVEVWQHNCGESRFNGTLYFDGARLAKIETSRTYGAARKDAPEDRN